MALVARMSDLKNESSVAAGLQSAGYGMKHPCVRNCVLSPAVSASPSAAAVHDVNRASCQTERTPLLDGIGTSASASW